VPELDDAYAMLIRRANLDAMGGRAKTTIEGHAASLQRFVKNASQIRRTPSIPVRGPMPLEDKVGMGIAVDLLLHSLTAKPRLKGEKFIHHSIRYHEASPSNLFPGVGIVSCRHCRRSDFHYGNGSGNSDVVPYSATVVWTIHAGG